TLYSYVMNNYWETNYKAGQEGPTTFRYAIKPHRQFDPGEAARFGTECGQPLVVVPVDNTAGVQRSILSVKPAGVVVTALKPSLDGKDRVVRLFNTGERTEKVVLTWAKPAPKTVWLSNLAEEKVSEITGPIEMAAYEIVTLRASLPEK
ncbi:MAG: glycosyl hydrolase-related protein, partial [Planctomycetota bacterium]